MHGVMDDSIREIAHGNSQGGAPCQPEAAEERCWQPDKHQDQGKAQNRGCRDQSLWATVVFSVHSLKRLDAMEHEPVHCIFNQAPARQTRDHGNGNLGPDLRGAKCTRKRGSSTIAAR